MEELNPWLLPFTVWRLPFTGRKSAVPRESLHTRTGPPGRWKRRGGSQSAPRRASSSPAPTTGAGAERGVSRLRPCLARAPSRPRSHADQRRRPARKGAGPRVSLPRLSCTGALRPPVHSTCFWPAWPRGPQRGRWAGFYLTKLNSSTCSWIPHYLNRGGDIRGKETKSSVHLLSCVWLFATPWPAARQASLSITNSWSLLKLMSIESVMPSSAVPFSCLQSFPASGSFQMSLFFTPGGQIIGISASTSVHPMNIPDWFPLGWTCLISLQSEGLSRVFSNTTVQKHQFFGAQLSL